MDTKRVDLFVIKTIQLIILTFFTCAVFLYYGFAVMIPMAIFVQLSATLATVFGDMIGTTLGLITVSAALFYIAKVPGLMDACLAIGIDVGKMGAASIERIGQLSESVKNDEEPKEVSVEVTVKEQKEQAA